MVDKTLVTTKAKKVLDALTAAKLDPYSDPEVLVALLWLGTAIVTANAGVRDDPAVAHV